MLPHIRVSFKICRKNDGSIGHHPYICHVMPLRRLFLPIVMLLAAAMVLMVTGCDKKRGDTVSHTIRYEVSSDTTAAYTLTVQLIKNYGQGGDEIIANTPQKNVPLPFSTEIRISGIKKYDSFNYALTAEVKKTSKLTLKVYIDGKLKTQQTGIRMDFLGEHGIEF